MSLQVSSRYQYPTDPPEPLRKEDLSAQCVLDMVYAFMMVPLNGGFREALPRSPSATTMLQ